MHTAVTQTAPALQAPVGAAARAVAIVEAFLFWGILGFGALFPFVGAAYALMRG